MLVNAAKCQGYSFYLFWVIMENQQGRGITSPPPTTEISAKKATFLYDLVVHTKTMLSLVWRWTFYFHQLSWNKTLRIPKTFFLFFPCRIRGYTTLLSFNNSFSFLAVLLKGSFRSCYFTGNSYEIQEDERVEDL